LSLDPGSSVEKAGACGWAGVCASLILAACGGVKLESFC